MTVRSLHYLFEPERILWIGPSQPAPEWARIAEATIWAQGFAGPIRSLRTTGAAPKEARIESLADAPTGACLAVVCLPQEDYPDLLARLAARGCRAVNLVGGGAAAYSLDAEQARAVRDAAKRLDLRVVGPDRVGVLVPGHRFNTGAATAMPPPGDLAFVSQSDSIAGAMLEWAARRRIGFSCVASLGESPEVEIGDILDFLALDVTTRAVLVHLEGVADARRFMSAARAAARVKPVLVLKSGRHVGPPVERGGTGMRLHRDRVYEAALARAGLVRVDSIEQLFAAASSIGPGAARRGRGLRNGRLALLTNGHGPAELAADALLAGGGTVVRPTPAVYAELEQTVGELASIASSIDLGPDADGATYAAAIEVLLETAEVDGLAVIHAPAAGIDPAMVAEAVATAVDRRKPRGAQRPVLAAWLGAASHERARPALEAAAIPSFATPEAAARAFLYQVQHERRQFVLRQIPASRPDGSDDRWVAAERLIAPALAAERRELNEAEAMALLDAYGIPSAPTRLAADLDGAARAARDLGYPVALKIVSRHLPRKSSVGGVALDIVDKASLLRRGRRMLDEVAAAAPGTTITGLLVQRMQRSLFPIELYLGVESDPTFGPVILLGHAALRSATASIAYILPPLDSTLAQAMLDESPIGPFLRQQQDGAAIRAGVVATLVRLSDLIVEQPAVRSLAIDPLLVTRDRLVFLDAHVGLARPAADAGARLAVRPYPRELEQAATLRDGREIRLRPIRPEDAPTLQLLFHSLTPEDRRKRLFSSMRDLPDEFAARLTQIDYDREMVLVALDPDQPDLFWGGARIAADADNRRAEYSVTVRSDRQGLGLGRICLERVLDYARARSIREVWGSVLAENDGMLGLAERLGFTRRNPDSPEIFLTERRLG